MPANVEIKARLEDIDTFHTLFKKVYQTKDDACKTLEQKDTFFKCPNGRLKLREVKCQDEETIELIYYDRSDAAGPKKSDYVVYKSAKEGADLKEALTKAHGTRGEVKKTRFLYIVDKTRVHIDKVNGVGSFVELEVQLQDGQTVEDGQKIANEFMEKLNITSDMLVERAYIDLLGEKSEAGKDNGVASEAEKACQADQSGDKEMKEVSEETAKVEGSDEKKAESTEKTAEEKKPESQTNEAEKPKTEEAKPAEDAAKAAPEKDAKADADAEKMEIEDAATEKSVEAKAAETPAGEVGVDANTEA